MPVWIVKLHHLFVYVILGQFLPRVLCAFKNVFKKFYRIENQFNQNGSVGIGLAFCKEVANFLDGDIEVKSESGAGSEFIVSLPFNYNELVTKS